MQAQLQRQIELLDKRRQPASSDGTRIPGDGQDPYVLSLQQEMVAPYLGASRGDEIRERPGAESEEPLVWRKSVVSMAPFTVGAEPSRPAASFRLMRMRIGSCIDPSASPLRRWPVLLAVKDVADVCGTSPSMNRDSAPTTRAV